MLVSSALLTARWGVAFACITYNHVHNSIMHACINARLSTRMLGVERVFDIGVVLSYRHAHKPPPYAQRSDHKVWHGLHVHACVCPLHTHAVFAA